MLCPKCRARNLVLRIVGLDHYEECPEVVCGYRRGPLHAGMGDIAFA